MRTYLLICLILGLVSAHYGAGLVAESSDAIAVIITVMTVFAGLLVAIITILGDPSMIPPGSWRKAEVRHARLQNIIIRHTYLFYFYLMAIGFLFVGILLEKEPAKVIPDWIISTVQFLYVFLSSFSFFLTLALPRVLGKIQLERSEAEIERRRTEEGIAPHE